MDHSKYDYPFIFPSQKLVIITNGKCGGSSVKYWLFNLLDITKSPFGFWSLTRQTSFPYAWWFYFGKGRNNYAQMQDRPLAKTQRYGAAANATI